MSLFGSTAQGASGSTGGLFGNAQNTTSSAGGLFGSTTTQTTTQPASGGLFASSNAQNSAPASGGGLFGSNTNSAAQPSTGGGLFGSTANATNQTPSTGGLFGTTTNTSQPSTGGLFGSNTNTAQPATGGGLFGNAAAANNNQTSSAGGLFGSSLNQKPAGTSLFGTAQNTGATNAPSLFGNQSSANNAGMSSLFGNANAATNSAPAQPAQQQLNASLFTPPTVSVGAQGHLIPSASLQRLQMSGYSTVPNEKKVADQIRILTSKWNPQDENTLLKAYLYNAVDKAYAPFFYPDARSGEDERSWEEALSQKPTMPKVEGAEATALAFVPVMCRGFKALGERVETQAKSVLEMRNRLHEMNNSLSAVMDKHQQSITVRIENARRQHLVLSQRCLHLAVKVQVLRNRGYALDTAEESLRKTLIGLSRQVNDDGLSGREDEIWARMVALRERTRWLEEEGKRVAAHVDEQNRQGAESNNGSVPEDVLLKTRRILKDYDNQLMHLNKELEDVKREFAQWQGTQR